MAACLLFWPGLQQYPEGTHRGRDVPAAEALHDGLRGCGGHGGETAQSGMTRLNWTPLAWGCQQLVPWRDSLRDNVGGVLSVPRGGVTPFLPRVSA